MQFTIRLIAIADDGAQVVHDVVTVERAALQPETLGLSLAEGKAILSGLQTLVVERQVAAHLESERRCPACGKARRRKGRHPLHFRTIFGPQTLTSPRLRHCPCQGQQQRTFSPLAALLPERTSPELTYLATKGAALASYGLTTKLLQDVLPLDTGLHPEMVRRQVQRVAERAEQALGSEPPSFIPGGQCDRDDLPIPDGPLTVGLDGGYVRGRRKQGWFEVIAGKSVLAFRRDDPDAAVASAKCFGFVHTIDPAPKRRLFELLTSQGMQANQQLTFVTDGGDTVRALPALLHPNAEHLLDWFHVALRLTVMGQYAKGLATTSSAAPVGDDEAGEGGPGGITTQAEVARQLASIKWYLWHGNVPDAPGEIQDLAWRCDVVAETTPSARKLAKALAEFAGDIENNRTAIPNYGERYRNGEAISSAIAESAVNQVVSKRMVKKQQMQWTPRGAHLLLQTRTRVLNGELEATFRDWYPAFRPEAADQAQAAA